MVPTFRENFWRSCFDVALEHAGIRQIGNIVRTTTRANHLTIWPTKIHHEPMAVFEVRVVDYRFLQSGWCFVHVSTSQVKPCQASILCPFLVPSYAQTASRRALSCSTFSPGNLPPSAVT